MKGDVHRQSSGDGRELEIPNHRTVEKPDEQCDKQHQTKAGKNRAHGATVIDKERGNDNKQPSQWAHRQVDATNQ